MRKASVLMWVAVVLVAVSAAQKGKPVDTPVTSSIAGGAPNADVSVTANRILSDQLGSYANGTNGISSILQADAGDWDFDLASSSLRRVTIDFREAVPGTANTPPFSLGSVAARFIAKCGSANGISFPNMIVSSTSTLRCPLAIAWPNPDGSVWRVAINPANFPQTNWVLVTCMTANTAGACSHWTLTPTGFNAATQQVTNVVHLVRHLTIKGKIVEEDHGDYYMAFSIDITRQ